MAKSFICEVCTARRDQNPNGWYLLYLLNDQLVLATWDDHIASDSDMTHACGQGCALALTERYLWQRNFAPFIFTPMPSAQEGATVFEQICLLCGDAAEECRNPLHITAEAHQPVSKQFEAPQVA